MKAVFSRDERLAVVDGSRYVFLEGGGCDDRCDMLRGRKCLLTGTGVRQRCCRVLGRETAGIGCWVREKERKR
jgi:hypothetical protein